MPEAAIYDYEGLDVNILNKLAKEGKLLVKRLSWLIKRRGCLTRRELLRQETQVLDYCLNR